jgi:ABC-type molybdate transport system permease subunit
MKQKQSKLFVLLITIIGSSVVIFNSADDLIGKLFKPTFNWVSFFGLLAVVVGVTIYSLVNSEIFMRR